MTYEAPLNDILFTLKHIVGFEQALEASDFQHVAFEDAVGILREAGKFASRDLAPINQRVGEVGCSWQDHTVKVPGEFHSLLATIRDGGWMSLPFEEQFGGQALPYTLSIAFHEMLASGCLAFDTCLCLSEGAIKAIQAHANDELKSAFLPRLISGDWTGTMCLTEPHAGTDVGAIRTKAEAIGGGRYLLTGTKIFITFGEHDLADNIIHLVLARLPGAPAGSKGISLFLVPKYVLDADGEPCEHNDVRCLKIEKKLGLSASPTCVMQFGEKSGAIGYLVGEENKGLAHMFTMMNVSRLQVGMQGVGIAERAYQQALQYAQDRTQGRSANTPDNPAPIIAHEDVRRMLMVIKSQAEAARAICLKTAVAIDVARTSKDEDRRAEAILLEQLLTPVAKAYSTDVGVEAASLAIQVHGGMGFVEETGVAQYYRDVRITPIYEGTNGVQAQDLVFRKIGADGGQALLHILNEMADFAANLDALLARIAVQLRAGIDAMSECLDYILTMLPECRGAAAAAVAFQDVWAKAYGHYLLARGAQAAQRLSGEDEAFTRSKIQTALFYGDHILLPSLAKLESIKTGASSLPDAADLVAAKQAHFAA